MAKIAIIGGSGLGKELNLAPYNSVKCETPYGKCSDFFTVSKYANHEIYLLPRHGASHAIPPHNVNYQANIWAMKELGIDYIFSTTCVGSLQENIKPGDIVFPDQFIDFSRSRKNTFYDSFASSTEGHTPMSQPFSEELRNIFIKTAKTIKLKYHTTATLITIEGPRFSTKAESFMFKKWGGDIINMTVATECALANELKIPYVAIALATDYDCWKEGEVAVSHDKVLEAFSKNANKVHSLLLEAMAFIQT